ncbi:hypothetical protein MIND_01355600 [Mycena indigotica]|uniref:Mob1/phocein n=1 Tax=Mycena indigotica TaxID=2126181 RepID=A0A8H6RZI3_9AGAR|nr:uncharacterized protein MIND_01355600 [Mycena indigotica]KAF7289813.1 hypothetical protein MIND_01355600 [Mycena indigotica]
MTTLAPPPALPALPAVIRRPLRGSRISTFYPVKTLPALASLDSAFQLQEYISLVIRADVHDVERIVSLPGRKEKGQEGEGEERKEGVVVDEACWKYEQLRRLAQDLSHPLITQLQQVCTRATCPEMKAGEWLYLCVAHGNDGAMEQCCAIDYILHTLDSATALLNSPRAFPSRLQIPAASHRHFSSLARRLGRIFAHAYFHHREEFEQAEAESSLYARFLALTEKFDLVPADFLVIPPRVAETANPGNKKDVVAVSEVPAPTLLGASLQVNTHETAPQETGSSGSPAEDALSPSTTARRLGRSRTDTMMLEGEGRFPASPMTTAAEDGPSLESVLALAETAPPVAALVAATEAKAEAEAEITEEPEAAPAQEADTTETEEAAEEGTEDAEDKSAEDAHAFIAQGLPEELEPESPPADGGVPDRDGARAGAAVAGGRGDPGGDAEQQHGEDGEEAGEVTVGVVEEGEKKVETNEEGQAEVDAEKEVVPETETKTEELEAEAKEEAAAAPAPAAAEA